jgi:hypothetical protein
MIGRELNYLPQYTPYIKKFIRTSRQAIQPLNIYKVQTYRYVDGVVRSKTGLETSLIFPIGIYNKELYAVRLNEIKPNDFFTWTFKIINKESINSITQNVIPFRQVIKEFNRDGRDIFMGYIKSSSVMYTKNNKESFRTYRLENIIYTQEAVFETEKIKKIYG